VSALDGEDRLLLAVAHPVLSPLREAQLRRGLDGAVDWPALIARAERHDVAPVVCAHLCGLASAAVPAEARMALGAAARRCVATNLGLRHELGRVLDALAAAEIDAMPLKGPVLADEIYPAPLLRPSVDLDVLVRAEDRPAAGRVLSGLGYARRRDAEQGADYHTIFTRGGVDLELHHDVGELHVSRLDVAAVWRAATPSEWHGHRIRRMAADDALVYAAFHAVKDGLASLKALVDITLLVERHVTTLAWSALAVQLRAAHLAPVVYLALFEARALLGAPVPEAFLDTLRPRFAAWRLAERLFAWRGGVLRVPDELLVGPFMATLMLLWEDTARARLRHLTRNAAPSARLRGRWVHSPLTMSPVLGYPLWVGHVVRSLIRQLATRRPPSVARS
jgi:putative nucleotidyltransferase-like protein